MAVEARILSARLLRSRRTPRPAAPGLRPSELGRALSTLHEVLHRGGMTRVLPQTLPQVPPRAPPRAPQAAITLQVDGTVLLRCDDAATIDAAAVAGALDALQCDLARASGTIDAARRVLDLAVLLAFLLYEAALLATDRTALRGLEHSGLLALAYAALAFARGPLLRALLHAAMRRLGTRAAAAPASDPWPAGTGTA